MTEAEEFAAFWAVYVVVGLITAVVLRKLGAPRDEQILGCVVWPFAWVVLAAGVLILIIDPPEEDDR
jgi:hypothetical protein